MADRRAAFWDLKRLSLSAPAVRKSASNARSGTRRSQNPMSENRDEIDWSLTTWEGSRRAQLRHALTLTVRERLEAAEGLAEVGRRFEEIRRAGGFKKAPGAEQDASSPGSASEEPGG